MRQILYISSGLSALNFTTVFVYVLKRINQIYFKETGHYLVLEEYIQTFKKSVKALELLQLKRNFKLHNFIFFFHLCKSEVNYLQQMAQKCFPVTKKNVTFSNYISGYLLKMEEGE